jgi:glycine/D-amino acid oxidase-like deaminating enzyme
MAPQPTPVSSDETLPEKSDVVIIGGGIIGAVTALELAERGIEVTLLEKGIIAGEQSSRNWGWVRQMGRDPVEIPLIVKSTQLWKQLDKRIGAKTGYVQCGISYLLNNEKDIAHYSHWSKHHAQPGGIKSEMIGQEKIDKLYPHNTAKWHAALHTPDDGRAEPQLAAPAIALAARKHGAKIFTNCAVRGLEKQAGRVSAVVTEKGILKTSSLLLAGGAWSRHFCDRLGIRLPQLTVISSVLRTAPMQGPEITASGEEYTFRKRLDGGYTITPDFAAYAQLTPAHFRFLFDFLPLARKNPGHIKLGINHRFIDEINYALNKGLDKISPFEQVRIFDPAPVDWMLERAIRQLEIDFPVFKNFQTIERWAGCIDVMPDEIPVIDQVESLPGFHLATGFSGHGFGIGPGAGKLAADIITGDAPVVDPAPFSFKRLS